MSRKSQFSRNDGKPIGRITDCFKTIFHFQHIKANTMSTCVFFYLTLTLSCQARECAITTFQLLNILFIIDFKTTFHFLFSTYESRQLCLRTCGYIRQTCSFANEAELVVNKTILQFLPSSRPYVYVRSTMRQQYSTR